ncbi:glycosyltransferase family 4 protein [Palleronia caenipelagi]|uniref:Glycosyltransferase family 4 protein n=1 Tax=Palleronia caenipelagi TaxID=2489174 RepID=A0A547PPN9_9RHOB|nr:glycosyltransferase family 4 protein [Palleronia caenipelagi]TRD16004.1 glycosyltransferase family 4 protein [Palleronia caenipelagi]
MRIAYVSADRGIPVYGAKGASIHIQAMMRAFEALGHEVRCITARSGGEGPFSVETVSPSQSGADREAKERAAMAQAEAIAERLETLHSDWSFDLIYERYSLWSAAGVRAGARLGVPVAVEVNAPLIDEQRAFRELICEAEARALESEVLRGASLLAAVSEQVATWLRQQGAGADRVQVIGNAVDTRAFHPGIEPNASVPDGAFCVGFTGSLKRWHGVDTLLTAFRALRADVPEAHLLVVGDGPKRGWVEGFVAGAELQDSVTLTGWVDHHDLPPLIARMDIATAPYPASEDHYFSPLKLYEYLAMGRPVVASDIGQTSALLQGSDAAQLLPPGGAEALARCLRELAKSAGVRARMAAASAAEGRRHDWIDNARAVLDHVAARRSAA